MILPSEMKQFGKQFFWRLAPNLSRRYWVRPGKRPFSIGIYTGDSPFSMRPAPQAANPVLTTRHVTDVPARIVADPFMLEANGSWFMFFEVDNQATMKGEIALATSDDGFRWQYRQIVLVEPWHLSYPCVFEWQGEYFMIPESSKDRKVSLYRATNFPLGWVKVATLLEGGRFADNTIFRHADHWWMLVDKGPTPKQPILGLYSASSLTGPWQEHPGNPLVEDDPHITRPGGRVVILDGLPIRLAQDIYPDYGKCLYAFQIQELSDSVYRERPISDSPILAPGEANWNMNGMHHMDAHCMPDGTWLACVDGY